MTREIFDYSKISPNDFEYYGFHLKNGRYHIDTKRLKKLHCDGCFPQELFTAPRNTHYFVPKHKNYADYAINVLMEQLNKLTSDWNTEYKAVISKITTPKEVIDQTRVNEIAFTSSADDLDDINFEAFRAGIRREVKYDEVIKSIHFQYVQGKFNAETKRANPLYSLPHYKWFDVLNKIDNFLKHNTVMAYIALANNPFEKDDKLKKFQSKFVYSKKEAGHPYENGMYAGNWVKIKPSFVDEMLVNLREFAKEFCKLVYEEDIDEAHWNSDESLLKILRDNYYDFM